MIKISYILTLDVMQDKKKTYENMASKCMGKSGGVI
jgi:hypothetical protein